MAHQNKPETLWTVSLLDIHTADYVLEVGFGPGTGIEFIANRATGGFTAGVDVSQTMLEEAVKRNDSAIRAGRVELKRGDVASLPYPNEFFHKAMSIHSIYSGRNLWRD